ncbi:MAG: hypothetical protein WEC34_01860 [Acidimicrobiia bacterium]
MLVAVVVVVAAGGWMATVPASAGTAGQTAPPDRRAVEVRKLELSGDEVLTVALHPSSDIEVSARGLDLDVCPATWNGEVATAADSSWPAATGFTECRPLADGTVRLASPGGGMFHLVLAVRAHDSATTGPGRLLIRYGAADGFFVVGPPSVPPGARGPIVRVVPTTRSVAAGLTGYTVTNDEDSLDLGAVQLGVHQGASKVPETTRTTIPSDWPTFGPVVPGRAVTVRAENRGREPIRFAIGITWE